MIKAVPIISMDTTLNDQFDYLTINDAYNSLDVGIFKNDVLIYHTGYRLPFTQSHSRYQNVKEFMGFILSILMIAKFEKAPRGSRIKMLSDNMAAITWIKKNRANSVYAQIAFFVYVWTILLTGFIITDVEHIPGNSSKMKPLDDLSRDRTPKEFDQKTFIQTTNDSVINELFSLCNPSIDNKDSPSCLDQLPLMKKVVRLLKRILQ